MNEQTISTVTPLEQRADAPPEGEKPAEGEPQPTRLLGELSRASQSLAEVLDSLTAEKTELAERLARIEGELERARAATVAAKGEAASAVKHARTRTAAER